MRSLLNFFARYNNIIIFLILEVIAIFMLTRTDGYHNIMISRRLLAIEGSLEKVITGATEYLSLKQINKTLSEENLDLKNRLEQVFRDDDQYFTSVKDTVHKQQYIYTRARIINKSINKQKNFITLNKGVRQGVDVGMAVVGPTGIVGTIVGTSRNYSVAMSVLNLDFKLSARFRKNDYFGSISWDGTNYESVSLDEIPHHLTIEIGDTIETTGFSSVFPEGQYIGTVSGFDTEGGDFYNIEVTLATDFHMIRDVYIIGNLLKEEQEILQEQFNNNN